MYPRLKFDRLELANKQNVNRGYALNGAFLVMPPSFVNFTLSMQLNNNTPITSAYPSMRVQLASDTSVVAAVPLDDCDDPSSTVVVVKETPESDSDPATFSRFTIASCSMLCMPKKRNIKNPTRAI
jgi:sporulation-control protein spo0M